MNDHRRAGVGARVLLDAIVALMFCLLVGIPATAVGWLTSQAGWLPRDTWWRWAMLPLIVLAFLVALLLTTSAIRAVLPRLRPGTYPFPLHRQSIVWLLHFSLQRLAYLPVWRHLLFAFSTLRWALLRALGARAAFDMDASSDVLILDGPLITLGRGSMIGGGCTIAGHIVEHGRLLLAPVVVGRGVQIANDVMVAPGVTIGDDAVVGPGSRIGAGASIGAFAYLGAECAVSPGIRIGAHAVVGHQVSIGPGVTLGEGAVIETGSRIPKGVAVGDGARWPPAVQQAGA